MRARNLAALTLALAGITPAVAGERGPSYSLEQLRALARAEQPTLHAAEAAVAASSALLTHSRAYPNPRFFIGFGQGRPRDGGDSRSEHLIEIAQPIEMPGIRKWRAQLAETQLRGVRMDRVMAETVVDSTMAHLVYTVLLEERRTEIARGSSEVAGHLHTLLERREALGESSPLEVTKARTEWFARRRDLLDAEGATAAARSALQLFCGDRLPGTFQIAETLQGSNPIDVPPDLVERLLIRNPLLLRAQIAVEEAQATTEVARKDVFPVIELVGGLESELDREGWNAGVGLTIPLWNRNRGAITASTAQQSAASAEVRNLTLELEAALEQATVAYRRALGAIRLHQEGWTSAARKSLDIATFSFENGEASLLEVLDAQRSYLSVGLAEAESWAMLAFARADIERLTAGPMAGEESDDRP